MSDDRASAAASAIVSQSRHVDQSKLANLLEQFRPLLRANARQSLSPRLRLRADESDLAQETLSKAVKEFGTFQGKTDAELVGWLQAILKQEVAAVTRRNKAGKRDVRKDQVASEDSSARPFDVENSGLRKKRGIETRPITQSGKMRHVESRKQIEDALADLRQDQQLAVRLKLLDRWSYQEIEDLMGKTDITSCEGRVRPLTLQDIADLIGKREISSFEGAVRTLTLHEIAEVMNKTERAVAGLLRRGMSQLKDVLSGLQ